MSCSCASISIIIKALNEEANIRRSIESALKAVGQQGLVILADSGSTDKTISIAQRYPVSIVQLLEFSEKSCGIGAQLGFQFAHADFVYILDGDMELNENFLPPAIAFLESNPEVAGVAGMVEEFGANNYEFKRRKAAKDGMIAGRVAFLDMGGLYRASAIEAVGYLTNRNLHSYEEKELAYRLAGAGFHLARLPVPAIKHYGKIEGTATLLANRWKSRHLDGPGEWLRSVPLTHGVKIGISHFWKFFVIAFSWIFLVAGILLLPSTDVVLLTGMLLQLGMYLWLVLKRKSLGLAGIAYINMAVCTAAMLRGLLRSQIDPSSPIAAKVLK